jgi:diguanylate cyclase (GGDEF)-like protein
LLWTSLSLGYPAVITLDQATSQTIERFRFQVLRLYNLIALLVVVPLVPMYHYMGLPALAAAVATYFLGNLALWLWLRRLGESPQLPARLFTAATLALILYSHHLGNEILDNKPWLVLVPVIAMSLTGAREGLLWTFGALLVAALIYVQKPGGYELFSIGIQFAAVITTSLVIFLFTRHNERNIALISRLSNIDPLTGSYNRRFFDDHYVEEFNRARRSGEGLAVVMVDIDHFKDFNDRYGHQAGDEALQRVAEALRHTARRAGDVLYRYGGEEFCVLLTGADHAAALAMAEQLRRQVQELRIAHAGNVADHVTISVGLCHRVHLADVSPEVLLQLADRALYRAKALGRNRVMDADSPV